MSSSDTRSPPHSDGRRRVCVRVRGVVQGVGFRPHVYRLAKELALDGYVLNDARGVLLEVEGRPATVERFLERLVAEPPPLATVESVEPRELEPNGRPGFQIAPSREASERASVVTTRQALVSPDTAPCAECLTEMRDPRDRRHRYPFVNCTNCGPRFTIAIDVPYDRISTTMAGFVMCERCRAEYEDPGDRRFHAQPNACPACGPRARLLRPDDATMGDEAVRGAAEVLAKGLIVAVKGLGGYHLACRADFQVAVAVLRARKQREERPFALMVADVAAAEALIELDTPARELLEDRARPIVIARRRAGIGAGGIAGVAEAVAPGCPDLGVMLPYTPLHHLLLADFADLSRETGPPPLVMTSGNRSDEPIAYDDEDALARLAGIADAFLMHDRPIHMRTDDSVVRHTAVGPLAMRRSRGYVPGAIPCPYRASAAARVRGRAEEHVLRGQEPERVGRPSHRRPEELRDAALLPSGRRALPAPVRRRSRGRRPRPAPRLPLDGLRNGTRRWARRSPSSTTTPTSPPAWPSTGRPDRPSA